MSARRSSFRLLFLSICNLQFAICNPCFAAPIPAPTEQLKDYHGRGIIQIDIPPAPVTVGDGRKIMDSGISMWVEVEQAFVWPDRMLVVLKMSGTRQVSLALANTEWTYNPDAGYVLQRTYKNLGRDAATPMTAAQMSMASYARLVRELDSGKLLPDEDLEHLPARHKERIKQLEEERQKLNPKEELQRFNSVSAEMARLADDLKQIEFRRGHPCHVVEFDNKDLVRTLLANGLMGNRGPDTLSRGKTRMWVTKAEGLPIRIEATDGEGRVALYFCFTEVRINFGLRSSELALNAPPGTRMISTTVDVRDRDWEYRMEKDLNEKIAQFEQERANRNRPVLPRKPEKPKGKG